MNNAEISHIKQILGLRHGTQYDSVKSLRYGHIMIMTDQDHDGSHIKGLLINFLHHHFPTLLKIPGFLVEFITPIIKATKGRNRGVLHAPEYENWKDSMENGSRVVIKYYMDPVRPRRRRRRSTSRRRHPRRRSCGAPTATAT